MTTKLKCLAIDDEPLALEQISSYIKKTPFLEQVCLCLTVYEAVECIENNTIDLLFVDINMPDINGFDFINSLTVKPLIIFTTAYREYGYQGFQAGAIDYILKPFNYTIFFKAVTKAKNLFEMKNKVCEEMKSPEINEIYVKSSYKTVRIHVRDIEYVESANEYIKIYLRNDEEISTFMRLKNFIEQLPEDRFMRVHRSFVIDLKKIKLVEGNRIKLNSGKYIPVGEQYRSAFQDYLDRSIIT